MPTDPITQEINRRQVECQQDLDAKWEHFRTFLASGSDGDIEPYINTILVAAMRLAMVPFEVEEDFRFLYGAGTETPIGLLHAH